MWAIAILGSYAVLVVVLASCSAYTALSSKTKPAARQVAYKIFRVVWSAGIVGVIATLLKLHEVGLL